MDYEFSEDPRIEKIAKAQDFCVRTMAVIAISMTLFSIGWAAL